MTSSHSVSATHFDLIRIEQNEKEKKYAESNLPQQIIVEENLFEKFPLNTEEDVVKFRKEIEGRLANRSPLAINFFFLNLLGALTDKPHVERKAYVKELAFIWNTKTPCECAHLLLTRFEDETLLKEVLFISQGFFLCCWLEKDPTIKISFEKVCPDTFLRLNGSPTECFINFLKSALALRIKYGEECLKPFIEFSPPALLTIIAFFIERYVSNDNSSSELLAFLSANREFLGEHECDALFMQLIMQEFSITMRKLNSPLEAAPVLSLLEHIEQREHKEALKILNSFTEKTCVLLSNNVRRALYLKLLELLKKEYRGSLEEIELITQFFENMQRLLPFNAQVLQEYVDFIKIALQSEVESQTALCTTHLLKMVYHLLKKQPQLIEDLGHHIYPLTKKALHLEKPDHATATWFFHLMVLLLKSNSLSGDLRLLYQRELAYQLIDVIHDRSTFLFLLDLYPLTFHHSPEKELRLALINRQLDKRESALLEFLLEEVLEPRSDHYKKALVLLGKRAISPVQPVEKPENPLLVNIEIFEKGPDFNQAKRVEASLLQWEGDLNKETISALFRFLIKAIESKNQNLYPMISSILRKMMRENSFIHHQAEFGKLLHTFITHIPNEWEVLSSHPFQELMLFLVPHFDDALFERFIQHQSLTHVPLLKNVWEKLASIKKLPKKVLLNRLKAILQERPLKILLKIANWPLSDDASLVVATAILQSEILPPDHHQLAPLLKQGKKCSLDLKVECYERLFRCLSQRMEELSLSYLFSFWEDLPIEKRHHVREIFLVTLLSHPEHLEKAISLFDITEASDKICSLLIDACKKQPLIEELFQKVMAIIPAIIKKFPQLIPHILIFLKEKISPNFKLETYGTIVQFLINFPKGKLQEFKPETLHIFNQLLNGYLNFLKDNLASKKLPPTTVLRDFGTPFSHLVKLMKEIPDSKPLMDQFDEQCSFLRDNFNDCSNDNLAHSSAHYFPVLAASYPLLAKNFLELKKGDDFLGLTDNHVIVSLINLADQIGLFKSKDKEQNRKLRLSRIALEKHLILLYSAHIPFQPTLMGHCQHFDTLITSYDEFRLFDDPIYEQPFVILTPLSFKMVRDYLHTKDLAAFKTYLTLFENPVKQKIDTYEPINEENIAILFDKLTKHDGKRKKLKQIGFDIFVRNDEKFVSVSDKQFDQIYVELEAIAKKSPQSGEKLQALGAKYLIKRDSFHKLLDIANLLTIYSLFFPYFLKNLNKLFQLAGYKQGNLREFAWQLAQDRPRFAVAFKILFLKMTKELGLSAQVIDNVILDHMMKLLQIHARNDENWRHYEALKIEEYQFEIVETVMELFNSRFKHMIKNTVLETIFKMITFYIQNKTEERKGK